MRYEDFCDDPEHHLRQIAETLDIHFDADFVNKWYDYAKLTGDSKSLKQGATARQIEPGRIPSVDSTLYERLQDCEFYHKTLALLGYQDVAVK